LHEAKVNIPDEKLLEEKQSKPAMYTDINNELANKGVQLVAVSKTQSNNAIMTLYAAGQRDFGENRVQELVEKQASLPTDIRWHHIGHLQRNKVKYIIPFIHLIHGVDSLELLREIERQAIKQDRVIDCLLQFHIALEESKFGFAPALADEWPVDIFSEFTHIRVCGVMGMATFTDEATVVRAEFAQLRSIFMTLKQRIFAEAGHFNILSMGMSDDYRIAIEEGSTMVRIGTLLFGSRS
jgi:PLP dependent protein